MNKKELPKRKQTRLKGFDYSNDGAYFITICTHERKNLFSNIVGQGLAPAEIQLTAFGEIAREEIVNLQNRYKHIKIDKYVIMPNHIHAIIVIESQTAGASPRCVDNAAGASPRCVNNAAGASPCPTGCVNNTAGASPCPTLSDVVCTFKSITTRRCHNISSDKKIWQTSFHDHIIRDEDDYLNVWNYIDTNAIKWADDCYYKPEV